MPSPLEKKFTLGHGMDMEWARIETHRRSDHAKKLSIKAHIYTFFKHTYVNQKGKKIPFSEDQKKRCKKKHQCPPGLLGVFFLGGGFRTPKKIA